MKAHLNLAFLFPHGYLTERTLVFFTDEWYVPYISWGK